MKKTYLLIIILLVLTFIFIVISILFSLFKNVKPINTFNVTPSPIITTVPVSSGNFVLPNSKPTGLPNDYPRGTTQISVLIEKLPHYESYFSLSYDFSADNFLLTLSTNESASGEAAFEKYLKQNNILDKSWLQNLTTNYQ